MRRLSYDRKLPARDQVPIPVEAVLRHTLERRIVDVDDPEALRIAEAPFEVVEEAPHEVPLHRRAVFRCAQHGLDVTIEIGRALGIVDAPVMPPDVAVGGAVL